MRFKPISVVMVCALLGLISGQGSNDEDAEYVNIEALFESNVTLYCNDSTLPDQFTFDYWIRPDTSIMQKGDFEVFRILDGEASWDVSNDGMELRVVHLQERQFGDYLCVGEVKDGNSSRVVAVKRGLNANGPYFGNLWPEYRLNAIIGLSAAGGYLLIVAILYGTYHFLYRGKKDDENREMSNIQAEAIETVTSNDATGGYDNQAHHRTSSKDEEKMGNVGYPSEQIKTLTSYDAVGGYDNQVYQGTSSMDETRF